ncbi:Sulfatase-modifying factor enzyme domain-containing protein [Tumidithrix helvetica PCC 7403]|uniref:formylglycine-generating enzyme family protein n=1 Tax=Tumidithrix helvetica TaxID=3457545 RepID=UPI003CA28886
MTSLIIRRHKSKARFYPEPLSESVTLDMMYIPSGEFLMGSAEDEEGSYDDERPQHKVTVPAFFMGKYPVTQAQYVAIMGKNPSHFKDKPDSYRRPVEQVRWEEANEFCQKLSKKTGRQYSLPSEAEWEYACRAMTSPPAPQLKGEGSKRVYPPFHYGETISTKVANYNGEIYGRGEKGEYRQETTPVDYFGVANDFGLCDMHGNVWEWCLDTWHDNYEGAPTDGSAWTDLNKTSHIRRGGSWDDIPRHCRSAYRFHNSLDFRSFNIGFRVVALPPGLF